MCIVGHPTQESWFVGACLKKSPCCFAGCHTCDIHLEYPRRTLVQQCQEFDGAYFSKTKCIAGAADVIRLSPFSTQTIRAIPNNMWPPRGGRIHSKLFKIQDPYFGWRIIDLALSRTGWNLIKYCFASSQCHQIVKVFDKRWHSEIEC